MLIFSTQRNEWQWNGEAERGRTCERAEIVVKKRRRNYEINKLLQILASKNQLWISHVQSAPLALHTLSSRLSRHPSVAQCRATPVFSRKNPYRIVVVIAVVHFCKNSASNWTMHRRYHASTTHTHTHFVWMNVGTNEPSDDLNVSANECADIPFRLD